MNREELQKQKRAKEQKKSKKRKFRILFFCVGIFSILFLLFVFFLNVLPLKYYLVVVGVFLLLFLFLFFLLFSKGWKRRMLGTLLSIFLFIGLGYGSYSLIHTYDFFQTVFNDSYKLEIYELLVASETSYSKAKDLKNAKIGIFNSDSKGGTLIKEKLEKKYSYQFKDYEDLTELFSALSKKEVEAVLLLEDEFNLHLEEDESLRNKVRCVETFEIKVPLDKNDNDVNTTKTPFSIYLAGSDTYGTIAKSTRNDVNMIITINPNTNDVFLTTIPRDYYVTIYGKNGKKDKLTHAGTYGIDTSIKTVEELLDISINYYVKVNFTSLISIVDSIGGIDIDNPISFRAYYWDNGSKGPYYVDYNFPKGTLHLDGKKALAYSRERHSFVNGDRTRGENQQRVLNAIIDKCLDTTLLVKYNSVISALGKSFQTNMSQSSITNLIKRQLDDNKAWTISNLVLNGTDSSNYTISYPSKKSYVMNPDEESVKEAKEMIQNIINKK